VTSDDAAPASSSKCAANVKPADSNIFEDGHVGILVRTPFLLAVSFR
jgi:hypothetical protein